MIEGVSDIIAKLNVLSDIWERHLVLGRVLDACGKPRDEKLHVNDKWGEEWTVNYACLGGTLHCYSILTFDCVLVKIDSACGIIRMEVWDENKKNIATMKFRVGFVGTTESETMLYTGIYSAGIGKLELIRDAINESIRKYRKERKE